MLHLARLPTIPQLSKSALLTIILGFTSSLESIENKTRVITLKISSKGMTYIIVTYALIFLSTGITMLIVLDASRHRGFKSSVLQTLALFVISCTLYLARLSACNSSLRRTSSECSGQS
jgi:hypothetical protein